jgi:endonuclease/exonuclease/phosphatase family metal-dependent hydrolase
MWLAGASATAAVHAVLEELDADVVVLQEVHPPVALPERWEDARGIAYDVVYGSTLKRRNLAFGNAVLSRHPIVDARRIDLSHPGREPRGALDVTLDVTGRELRVIGTHLGLRAGERSGQVRRLLEQCDAPGERLLVVLGDINEWRPRAPAMRLLEARFGSAPSVRSFPSRWPVLALDRVWTCPRHALLSLEAHVTPASSRASDHLPIVATVETSAARLR